MAEVNWTADAQRWLRDIYDYIASDNVDAALRVVLGIYEKAPLLRRFPELGYVYTVNQRYHAYCCAHYRIGYVIKPDGNIDIFGIFHGALDIDRYL